MPHFDDDNSEANDARETRRRKQQKPKTARGFVLTMDEAKARPVCWLTSARPKISFSFSLCATATVNACEINATGNACEFELKSKFKSDNVFDNNKANVGTQTS